MVEGIGLFNDPVLVDSYMASDIWDRTPHRAREETRCRLFTGYSFRLAARVLLYALSYRQDSVHTTAFVTPVVEHWLEREIAQFVHHEGSMRRSIAPSACALPLSYISLRAMAVPICRYPGELSAEDVQRPP